MNRFELFRTLRRHVKLSEKRSATYEQNRTAKVMIYIAAGFVICYMVFISIMLSLIANSLTDMTTIEFFFGLLPFMLAVDFLLRFIGQQTPAQLVKPYSLLPIPRHACVESFILSSMVSENNLLWMCLTVPFAIMSVLFIEGFWTALAFIFLMQVIVVINSQNYMFWRTLITRNVLWWIGAVAFYALFFLPWIITGDIDKMMNLYGEFGARLCSGNLLALLLVIALIVGYFFLNRHFQYIYTKLDSAQTSEKAIKHEFEFQQLERFGQTGEYIKLEIKSIMRNKNMRASFLYGVIFTIILSVIISYTDIYDDAFSSKFFMVYVFIISGAMLLVKVMGAEGNYIDGLMIHKENILQLLHAKYYFYVALLLLPFVIMIPTVFMGKYTLLQLVATMIFSAGPVYCVFMQMAVWNKQTIPLNSKLVSKGNVETNWFAVVAEMGAMFMPVIIISVLSIFFSQTVTFLIMLAIVRMYTKFNHNPFYEGVMAWVRPAVAGLIGAAAVILLFRFKWEGWQVKAGIVRENITDWKSWVLLAGAFVASYWGKVGPILVIILAGVAGFLLY